MRILLTNDDGIQAVGLRTLYRALSEAGHDVHVVAPATEQSAVGHAITIAMPLKVKKFHENGFRGVGVYGTPADCVKLGLSTEVGGEKPDLVVSGINSGCNVGVDIIYSGTVSAATEGALNGIPSLAVSYDDWTPDDLSGQARWVCGFVERMDWQALPPETLLNLNFPKGSVEQAKELKLCPQTKIPYKDGYQRREDPRGQEYYWLEGEIPFDRVSPYTDRALLSRGHITLTPLKFSLTDSAMLETLNSMGIR